MKLSNIYQHSTSAARRRMPLLSARRSSKTSIRIPACSGPCRRQGFFLRHIRNLEVSHVEIAAASPDPRPSFYLTEIERADFIAVTAPTGASAFHLDQVKDLRILLSRAAKDTQLENADNQTL